MNKITFVFPYYNSSNLIPQQIEMWDSYSDEIKKNLTIIIIDDCSTDKIINHINENEIKDKKLDLRIYEILEKKGWNSYGANNLGMCMADTQWVLRSDFDWMIPNSVIGYLMNKELADLSSRIYYTFKSKVLQTDEEIQCGPNIFFMPKSLFWMAGGYDEDFSGEYGWADILLLYRLEIFTKAKVEKLEDQYLLAVKDGSSHGLVRDGTINKTIYLDKRLEKRPFSEDFLRFKWKQIL